MIKHTTINSSNTQTDMNKNGFFNKSYYFNVMDLFAFLAFTFIALILGAIISVILLISNAGIGVMENIEEVMKNGYIIFTNYLVTFSIISICLLFYRRFRVRNELYALPLEQIFKHKIHTPSAIIYGIVFLFAANIVIEPISILFPESMLEYMKILGNLDIYSIMTIVILAPLFEEVVFRGIILNDIKRRHNCLVAVIVSSVVFGLIHLNIVQSISATLIGVILAYVFLATKSIWAVIFLHFLHNASSVVYIKLYPQEFKSMDTLYDMFDGSFLYYVIYTVALAFIVLMVKKTIAICKVHDKEQNEALQHNESEIQ